MNRIFFTLSLPISLGIFGFAGWWGYGQVAQSGMPKVEIRETSALAIEGERAIPFYELMSPMPSLDRHQLVPKLEYKKGPPNRFIEQIGIIAQSSPGAPKERIVYHGRRTRSDLRGISYFPEGPAREAQYLEVAIRLSQGQGSSHLTSWQSFLLKPFLLQEAKSWLRGVESVYIMEQAGVPAFFFEGNTAPSTSSRSTALFIRRNSFYRVDYFSDRGFIALSPLTLFRKSFLTEKRADALEYVTRNLSTVHLEQKNLKGLSVRDIAWPILLLAANVSIDPSSLDAFFHFAGISALLYRSKAMDQADTETLDILRNNVLASEFYANDVAPNTKKSAEISRLARTLTRSFE